MTNSLKLEDKMCIALVIILINIQAYAGYIPYSYRGLTLAEGWFVVFGSIIFVLIWTFFVCLLLSSIARKMLRDSIRNTYKKVAAMNLKEWMYALLVFFFAPGTSWNDVVTNDLICRPIGNYFQGIGQDYWVAYITTYYILSFIGMWGFTNLIGKSTTGIYQIKTTTISLIIWIDVMFIFNRAFGWFSEITLLI